MRSDCERLRRSLVGSMRATIRPRCRASQTVRTTYETRPNRKPIRNLVGGCVKLAPDDRERRARPARRARDRDAFVGLRQLGHALPRLPVAGRGAHRLGADRRRRARPRADGLLPERRAPHPVGPVDDWRRARATTRPSAGSGSARSTRTSSATTPTGSAASATPTPRCAPGARALPSSASRSRSEVGSTIISLWLADGTNYPGQDDLRGRHARLIAGPRGALRALPAGMRLLVEYKFFEPALLQHRPSRLGHRRARLPAARPAGAGARRHGPPSAGHEHRADRRACCSPKGCSAASTSTTASTPTTT